MSEAGTAVQNPPEARSDPAPNEQSRIAELKVSGHLMTLDRGLYCVFQAPGGAAANERTGLPGVRISLPPGPLGRPEALTISTFRNDGWLDGADAAALIRVTAGPAQILVTVYQAPNASPDTAPRLQVMRLGVDPNAQPQAAAAVQAAQSVEDADVVVHVQRTGDMAVRLGEWAGTRGSRLWIEGFSLAPREGIAKTDLEYQAVLGRGWLSPWIEGGKFCGSRGMALPLLGLKVRLKGDAAKTHECSYSATFVDGSAVGPVPAGETCEAESLAALEAFQIVLRPRDSVAAGRGAARGRPAQPPPPPVKPTRKAAASTRRSR